MAETVDFVSNGGSASGYLVTPLTGTGPGVIVIQEWWGVAEPLKRVVERIAGAGFVALAPDLYHGTVVAPDHDEMDKAAAAMNAMPPDRAARDLSGAVDFLAGHAATTGEGIGVVGLCMGGMLAFLLAANRPDRVRAAVPIYGFPTGDMEPDWSRLTAVVRGHMAENDTFFAPADARALETRLRDLGKDVTLTVHEGVGHAFMGPHNALGTYDEVRAERVWAEIIAFLHGALDA